MTSELFVYGTLTDPATVLEVLGRPCAAVPAALQNYERRVGRYAYLVEAQGQEVQGRVLGPLGAADFETLDEYEVVIPKPIEGKMRRLYTRALAEARLADGRSLRCWVYVPNLPDWPALWK